MTSPLAAKGMRVSVFVLAFQLYPGKQMRSFLKWVHLPPPNTIPSISLICGFSGRAQQMAALSSSGGVRFTFELELTWNHISLRWQKPGWPHIAPECILQNLKPGLKEMLEFILPSSFYRWEKWNHRRFTRRVSTLASKLEPRTLLTVYRNLEWLLAYVLQKDRIFKLTVSLEIALTC